MEPLTWWRRRTAVLTRSLTSLALLGLLVAGCARDQPETVAATTLESTEWQLVSGVVDWQPLAVGDVDAVLRFDGQGGWSARACNELGGTVTVEAATLTLASGHSTDVFCGENPAGAIDSALWSLAGQQLSWAVSADRLTLGAPDGTTLTFRVRDSIFPNADDTEILSGERGGAQYRLGLVPLDDGGLGLSFVSRDAAGQSWGVQEMAGPPDDPPLYTLIVGTVGDDKLVAGFVPADTHRATHAANGQAPPTELTVYDVGDPDWRVAAGFVPAHSHDSVLLAYDADGELVANWGR